MDVQQFGVVDVDVGMVAMIVEGNAPCTAKTAAPLEVR
jgi:hypothetical protein